MVMAELEKELNALKGLVKKKPEEKTEESKQTQDNKKTEKKLLQKKQIQEILRGKEVKKTELKGKFAFDLNKQEKEEKEPVNLKEKLSAFYYFFEDKYYSVLDKLNEKIPVYTVIDPIDKIVPSFVLFSGLILVLLLLVFSSLFFTAEEKAVLTITLEKENSDEILSDFEVFVSIDGNKNKFITDANAQIVLINLDLFSVIKIEVKNVSDFNDFNETIELTEKEQFFTVKLKKKEVISFEDSWAAKTIKFYDKKSGTVITDFIRAEFDCSKDNSFIEVSDGGLISQTTNGMIQIKVKKSGCGNVLVSAESADYKKIEKQVLAGTKLYLTKKEDPTGTIHVKIFDESDSLISDKMKFSLFEAGNSSPVSGFDNVSVYSGLKSINVLAGDYFIKVYDSAEIPNYSCQNPSKTQTLNTGEEVTFNAKCFAVGTEDLISINVVDSVSNESIVSDVELREKTGNIFEFVSVKKNVSNASFAVEDGEYIVLVSSQGYLPYFNTTELLKKGDSLIVKLVKATQQNSGSAKIKVLDYKGNTASSGNVFLKYGSGPLKDLRTPYSASIGFKGESLIENIKPGTYYAEAVTNDMKGISSSKVIDANKTTAFEVQMEKIRGIIELNVTELKSNAKIENFEIEFFNAVTARKISDSKYSFNPKTNSFAFDEGNYYAVISKETYYSVKTKDFEVLPKSKIIVNVVLKKISSSEKVSIDFIGLFKENGLPATSINLGQEYSADLLFTVNPDSNIFYFNFLIGTGRENSIEKDSIFISSFDSPFTSFTQFEVKKTTSFTGNYQNDFVSNSTQADAKAILVEFDDFDYDKDEFTETSFIVPVKIKVKESLFDANNLVLFFKALAVENRSSPEYFLDPEDETEFTSLEDYTYSNHKTKDLSLCNTDFCYSYSVADISTETLCEVLDFGSVSSIRINCLYKLSSFVLNNDKDYSSVDFSVENSSAGLISEALNALIFDDYLIKTKSDVFSGTANDRIITETFSLNEKELVYADANFIPVKLVKNLEGRIPGIKTTVYSGRFSDSNFHELRIRSDLNLNINLLPEEIHAFTETPLTVEVLDEKGNPVNGAEVKLKITDSVSNSETLFGPKETNESGEAVFDGAEKITGLYPLSLIEVTAEFDDAIASKEVIVQDANTFSFSPESLVFVFSSSDSRIKSKEVTFFDSSNGLLNQKINSYSISLFSNLEFFDENSFTGFSGQTFTSDGIITELNLSLNTAETNALTSNVSVDGNLDVEIELGSYVLFETIPFTVLINAVPGVSDYATAYFPVGGTQVSTENPVSGSLFFNKINLTEQFALKKNNGVPEIKITEVEIDSNSIYLDLTAMQESLETNKGKIISSDLIIDFDSVLASSASTITQTKTASGTILFTFDANNSPDFLVVPFETVILSDNPMEISPDRLDYVFYLDSDNLIEKNIFAKSYSNNYSSLITDVIFDLNEFFVSVPSFAESIDINSEGRNVGLTLTLTSEGQTLETSRIINGSLDLLYSVKGRDFTKTIPVKVSLLTSAGTIESESFDLKACIGEGSLNETGTNFDVSFWVGCSIEETASTDCSLQKPKIELNWNFSSFNVSSEIGKCTKENLAYVDYKYCDASQFSMELIYRLIQFKAGDATKTGSFSFNSTLITDNFSSQFFEDFDYWANNVNNDTPTSYKGDYDLVRKYFAESKFDITVDSYLSSGASTEIELPGWYNVTVDVQADLISLSFTLIKPSSELEPEMGSEDSVFYYIPFDGKIGLKGSELNRINYGSSFDVTSPNGLFRLNELGNDIYSSSSLSGYTTLWLRQFDDFNKLNSTLNKGTLMELARDVSTNLRTAKFYPSYATPILMKADLTELNNALIYYSIVDAENKKQLIEADNLTKWKTIGSSCVDFSGNPEGTLFSDRKTINADNINLGLDYDNVFKLSWSNPLNTGKTFLHSVLFSPVNVPLSYFKINDYSNNPFSEIKLYSSGDTSNPSEPLRNWIPLKGVSGTHFNSAPNSSADSLKELFDLIDSEYACVKNQGNFTYIVWNKEKLLSELTARETGIESECIAE